MKLKEEEEIMKLVFRAEKVKTVKRSFPSSSVCIIAFLGSRLFGILTYSCVIIL